jgi:signal transduction histidine kinase
MTQSTVVTTILLALILLPAYGRETTPYFSNLKALKFDEAKHSAASISDSTLRHEMIDLADLLFYAGQKNKNDFNQPVSDVDDDDDKTISVVRLLYAGYYNLFYYQLKGSAFRFFHIANQIATESGDPDLMKACAYAFLKYYSFEIAQNSDDYQPHLETLESLRTDHVDDLWITLYKMIFHSKSLSGTDSIYYTIAKDLDVHETAIDPESPLLAYLYYEKALPFYGKNELDKSAEYYKKAVDQSKGYPFLNTERFLALIKLMQLATVGKKFAEARSHLHEARMNRNQADTLRSDYYINLYTSLLLNAESKNDSAYQLLMKAYIQDFQLDFRRNTFEINRLNVELETQEKENVNLKLRETGVWLITALLATGLIAVASYFAYSHQRAMNRIQARDNEANIENMMKEQELAGINSMLEGQEKERQALANELHDNLGSVLTTLKFHFHTFRENASTVGQSSAPLLEHSDKLLDEAYQKVRTLAHLRNAGVDPNEGLLPAIKNFTSKVSRLNSLTIEVHDHGMVKRLDNSLEITLFRITQELISNVIKHAKASTATIHLTQHEQSLNILVEDNGTGFDTAMIKPSTGMGLYSIQKRVENLGGIVTIESMAKSGTTVIIDIPIV